jgi:signal transduction histidine kinase
VAGSAAPESDCLRRTYLSLRLPVPAWREALAAAGSAAWPPAQLAGTQVRLQFLGPGEGNVLFDSDNPGRSGTAAASAPFALAEFRRLLLPGETLRVQREGHDGVVLEARGADLEGADGAESEALPLPWLDELIRWLPVPGYDAPIEQRSIIATRLGNYRLTLVGDLRSVNRQLAAVATRLGGYVAAMLGAVLAVWLLLEVVVIRRIALLTRRAAAASDSMRAAAAAAPPDRLLRLDAALELGDLTGRDELGVLAQGLRDLLARVNADVERERIRVRQERDQWHAVGHEIVSPLQSLMALHGAAADPASRYLRRMQQAVRVLYGQASPSEAFESTQLTLAPMDLDAFAAMVAGNAQHIGIADVVYEGPRAPAWVAADEHSLEDVLTHVLRNADRHREPGTPITLTLRAAGPAAPADAATGAWELSVHNRGSAVAETMLERIFEYGVSVEPAAPDGRIEPPLQAEEPGGARRGQGLFVARTYMAKMGGTIRARNVPGGVEFVLSLPGTAAAESAPKR